MRIKGQWALRIEIDFGFQVWDSEFPRVLVSMFPCFCAIWQWDLTV